MQVVYLRCYYTIGPGRKKKAVEEGLRSENMLQLSDGEDQ